MPIRLKRKSICYNINSICLLAHHILAFAAKYCLFKQSARKVLEAYPGNSIFASKAFLKGGNRVISVVIDKK
jgi:hypothetical protein